MKPFELADWNWVSQATAKEPSRYAIQGVLVEPNRIVATNGYILLMAETEDGMMSEYAGKVWSVPSKKSPMFESLDSTFPDYRQIMPDLQDPNRKAKSGNMSGYEILVLLAANGITINLEYLCQALGVGRLSHVSLSVRTSAVTVSWTDKSPVVLQYGNRTALIMPIYPK